MKDLALLSDQIAAILSSLIDRKIITAEALGLHLHCVGRTAYNYCEGNTRLRADQFIVIALWLYSIGEREMLELVLPENSSIVEVSDVKVDGSLDDELIDATHAISDARQEFESGNYDKAIERANDLRNISERIIKEALQKKNRK